MGVMTWTVQRSHQVWMTCSPGRTRSGVRPCASYDEMLAACYVRCFGTFSNYLGHLRAACHAIGCSAPPVGHPAIKRGMVAIVKRGQYTSREKRFLDRCMRHVLKQGSKCRTLVPGTRSATWSWRCSTSTKRCVSQCYGCSLTCFCCDYLQRWNAHS